MFELDVVTDPVVPASPEVLPVVKTTPDSTLKVNAKASGKPKKVVAEEKKAVEKKPAVKKTVSAKVAAPKKAVSVKAVPVKASAVKPAAKTPKAKTVVAPAAEAKPVVVKKKAAVVTPVVSQVKPAKVEKTKNKLIRDSFTMPSEDWALIQFLKDRALGFKRPTKKSELLRAGLQALVVLSDAKLQASLDRLTPLKAGRPKGHGK